MSHDVTDQLFAYRDSVEAALAELDERDDTIVDFGAARRRPRWHLLVGAAAVLVILVGIGVGWAMLRDDPADVITDSRDSVPVDPVESVPVDPLESVPVDPVDETDSSAVESDVEPSPPSSELGAVTLDWELGQLPVTGNESGRLLSDGETFYWISFGNAEPGSDFFRIHSSTDDTTWTETEFEDPSVRRLLRVRHVGGVWAGQLVAAADSDYFFDPDSATEAQAYVEIYGVDGSVLASMLSPALDDPVGPTTFVRISDIHATIGPRGVVVVGRLHMLDFGSLLDDVLGADVGLVESVQMSNRFEDETLVIRLPAGSRNVRLLDHGIPDSAALEVAPSGPIGWHSTDGVTWTPIPRIGPFGRSDHPVVSVTATAEGFVAIDIAGNGWFSTDGLSWTDIDGRADPPESDGVILPFHEGTVAAVAWNGQVLLHLRTGGDIQTVSDQGFAKLLTEADSSSGWGSLGAGQAGIAYLVDVGPVGGIFDIVYSPDGVSWQRQQLPEGSGDPCRNMDELCGVAVGAQKVAVITEGNDGLELWLGTPTTQPSS